MTIHKEAWFYLFKVTMKYFLAGLVLMSALYQLEIIYCLKDLGLSKWVSPYGLFTLEFWLARDLWYTVIILDFLLVQFWRVKDTTRFSARANYSTL